MDLLLQLVDFVLHIDVHLDGIIRDYGTWTYAILFLIIFAETGLVVTPILPGDSLLFAAGAFAARGALSPVVLFVLLAIAAILGNTVNYSVGRYLAPRAQHGFRFIKQDYLDRTHSFYEKHGGKTIVITRFMPILRTIAPFVAGVGRMGYRRFTIFNVTGGVAWIAGFVFAGYFFGNIPAVEKNFTFVIMGIIIVSLIPAAVEFLRHRLRPRRAVQS